MRLRSAESRVVVNGMAVLLAVAAIFTAAKIALWESVVVHEEPSSVHRLFAGGFVLRIPQEPSNLADLFTGAFLVLGGVCALAIAFGMTQRLLDRRTANSADARRVRAFFRLAGFGLLWLGIDEVFL